MQADMRGHGRVFPPVPSCELAHSNSLFRQRDDGFWPRSGGGRSCCSGLEIWWKAHAMPAFPALSATAATICLNSIFLVSATADVYGTVSSTADASTPTV